MSTRRFSSPRGRKLTGLAKKYPLDRAGPIECISAGALPPAHLPPGRVVLAEMSAEIAAATAAALVRSGYRLSTVKGVDELWRALAREPFDLVILGAVGNPIPRIACAAGDPSETLTLANLHIDLDAHRVLVGERVVDLTAAEFTTLRILAQRQGRLCTRAGLTTTKRASARGVDMRISRIRRKLRGAGLAIECIRGKGYRLVASRAAS